MVCSMHWCIIRIPRAAQTLYKGSPTNALELSYRKQYMLNLTLNYDMLYSIQRGYFRLDILNSTDTSAPETNIVTTAIT